MSDRGKRSPSNVDSRQRLGLEGEAHAEAALRERGFQILERRWRYRGGEIDLVALDRGTLVFVEVKARSGSGFGTPGEAVDRRKRSRVARAALAYLQYMDALDRTCRFDVVEIEPAPGASVRVRIVEDAFRLTPTG